MARTRPSTKTPRFLLVLLTFCALFYTGGRAYFASESFFLHPRIGFSADYDLQSRQFVVVDVRPGSAAEKIGLMKGDGILSIGGEPVQSYAHFTRLVRRAQQTQRLEVSIQKPDGKPLTQTAELPAPQVELFSYPFFYYFLSLIISTICNLIGLAICWLRWEDRTAQLGGLFFISIGVLFSFNLQTLPSWLLPFFVLYINIAYWFSGYWCFAFFSEFPGVSLFASHWSWLRRLYLATLLAVTPIGVVSLLTYTYSFEAAAQYGTLTYQFIDSFISVLPVVGYFGAVLSGLTQGTLDADQRRRFRVMTLGIILGCGPTLSLMVMSFVRYRAIELRDYPQWLVATCLALFTLFPLSFAYTIVKHQVLGIQQILRRGLQHAFVSYGYLLVEVIILFLLVMYPATIIARKVFLAFHYSPPDMVRHGISYFLGALGLLAMWKINPHLQSIIDRAFFRNTYQAQQVLSDLGRSMRQLTQVEEVLQCVAERIGATLLVNRVVVFLQPHFLNVNHDPPGNPRLRAYVCRFDVSSQGQIDAELSLPGGSLLMKQLAKSAGPLEVYYNTADAWTERLIQQDRSNPFSNVVEYYQQERDLLIRINASLLIPLATKDGLLGCISLGTKLSEEPYTPEDKDLLMAMAEATALRLENSLLIRRMAEEASLKRELEIARTMQQSLLPSHDPILPGFECAGYSVSANDVGGDYYEYFVLNEVTFAIAVGDVTGHGVSSGLLMALAKGGLLNQISMNATPSAVMYAMNNLICAAGSRKNLMTFAYGVIDSRTLTIELSNAGHPPPYLYRAATKTVEVLESSAYPLGVRRNCEFPVLHQTLKAGDAIVFYSDGIIEAQNVAGILFGYERLEQAILENGDCSAEALRDAILDDSRSFLEVTRTFSGNSARLIEDDITLVVLKAKG